MKQSNSDGSGPDFRQDLNAFLENPEGGVEKLRKPLTHADMKKP